MRWEGRRTKKVGMHILITKKGLLNIWTKKETHFVVEGLRCDDYILPYPRLSSPFHVQLFSTCLSPDNKIVSLLLKS